MKVTLEVVERFHEKWQLDLKTGCWNWVGALAGKGYGEIKIPGTRRQEYAHRLSYQIHVGEIPKTMQICHVCDNPRCVRPSHLFAGTQKDNLQDMKAKDRHLRGARNGKAKLDDQKVAHIRQMHAQGLSQGKIARSLRISQTTVWKILRGRSWTHVP